MHNCGDTTEFRGAGGKVITINDDNLKIAWRRVRDLANKQKMVKAELVQTMITGGLHPSILKGLEVE